MLRTRHLLPLAICWLAILPLHLSAQAAPDYRQIDRRARRAPADLGQDLPALSAYLVDGLKKDRDKARALYTWITSHITYDREALVSGNWRINRDLADILRRGKAICFGYARLFEAMCAEVGLTSYVVSGYSKGTLTARPRLEEPDHAWNVLRLDGAWHLLDPTWGASVQDQDNEFVLSDSAFYFLTPPESFILNHLPAAPMWQLLPCPVPTQIYNRSPEQIRGWISRGDSCYQYQDSIRTWEKLPLPRRRLDLARMAHQFNPTAANARELGHAYMDFAGHLSDRADSLQTLNLPESLLTVQDSIIAACDRARYFADSLYAWQEELCLGALLNQAVACVQLANVEPDRQETLYRKAVAYLERAKARADALPSSSFYARQIAQQADAYLRRLGPFVRD